MDNEEHQDNPENPEGTVRIILGPDDSALLVRADGTVEVVSREMDNSPGGYVGDVEDLNKTFSLVLALAASLEDDDLYAMIFTNLNRVLMQQWEKLDDTKRAEIAEIRRTRIQESTEEERENKTKRVDEFRQRMERHRRNLQADQNKFLEDQKKKMMQDLHDEAEAEFLRRHGREFAKPEDDMEQPKIRKKKKSPSSQLPPKNVAWDPYHETLKAGTHKWRLDYPPREDEDE